MELANKHLTETAVSDNFMTIPGWEEWHSNNFCQAGRVENFEGMAFKSFHFT